MFFNKFYSKKFLKNLEPGNWQETKAEIFKTPFRQDRAEREERYPDL